MAQKSYGAVTLNGNWHEERSAPLNGVIASYHTANDYTSTNKGSFEKPTNIPSRVESIGMLRKDNVRCFSQDDIYEPSKFTSTFKNTKEAPPSKSRKSFVEKAVLSSAKRLPAGGHPTQGLSSKPNQVDVSNGREYMSLPINDKMYDASKFSEKIYNPRSITFGLTATHSDLQRVKTKSIFQDHQV